eukprot:TRINITY_DN4_c0_g6_i1.p1 TRINITY_DN4_c0_g6~~TRINITY_DN4_c0_g6_i1.p1  ORF type:complete len:384 (+),score=137.02 TRINITY_DN4_c0_g6_i1:73-1224(+)
MDRGRKALPSVNRLISGKINEKNRQMHLKKLKSIKSTVDNGKPKKHAHLRRNLKKEQMMDERYSEIERENRILLSKMSSIMHERTIDNRNTLKPKSLNREYRKRELVKITDQNQQILRRIQASRPTYDHSKWLNERKENEQHISRISEFSRSTAKYMKETRSMSKNSQRSVQPKYLDEGTQLLNSNMRFQGRDWEVIVSQQPPVGETRNACSGVHIGAWGPEKAQFAECFLHVDDIKMMLNKEPHFADLLAELRLMDNHRNYSPLRELEPASLQDLCATLLDMLELQKDAVSGKVAFVVAERVLEEGSTLPEEDEKDQTVDGMLDDVKAMEVTEEPHEESAKETEPIKEEKPTEIKEKKEEVKPTKAAEEDDDDDFEDDFEEE